jgi:hypothetical protein
VRVLGRTLLIFLVLIAVLVVLRVVTIDWILDRFASFSLSDPPGVVTSLHLRRFESEPEQCYGALRRGNVAFEPAARAIKDGCGYADGVILTGSEIGHGGPVLMRCPALVALLLWEKHMVAPAADRFLKRKVIGIRSLGTYSCRNINHAPSGRRSQHATANAIDVAGFSLAGGDSVTVARDWRDGGTKQAFLHAVRDGACRVFGVVLSPDYNSEHRDHLHFDRSHASLCR